MERVIPMAGIRIWTGGEGGVGVGVGEGEAIGVGVEESVGTAVALGVGDGVQVMASMGIGAISSATRNRLCAMSQLFNTVYPA
jgi:hypothetical protein